MPMLHVGGVHEAVTLTPPACALDMVTVPALLTLPIAKFEELQVRGTPVMVLPRMSVTVGVMVLLDPAVTLKLVVLPPAIVSEIELTGHDMKSIGMPFTLPALAKICASPGSFAVA